MGGERREGQVAWSLVGNREIYKYKCIYTYIFSILCIISSYKILLLRVFDFYVVYNRQMCMYIYVDIYKYCVMHMFIFCGIYLCIIIVILFVMLFNYPTIHLSIYLCIYLSIYLFIGLFIPLLIC